MQFSSPIALWGLAGLLIPIGIHLLSRKEGKIIRIGSVRHLDDTNTRQFKSIRLNEIGLLALRCLLIASVVFLLSGLYFPFATDKEKWLVIEKGLENDREFSSLIDSLSGNGYKLKLLAKDFPELSDSAKAQEKINYWQLIDAIGERPLNDVIVLAHSYLKGFSGRQASLPDNIQWISKSKEPVEYPLYAKQLSKDSIVVRTGRSSESETSFESTLTFRPSHTQVDIEVPDTISISVVSDSAFSNDNLIVNTALNVLDESTPDIFDLQWFPTNDFKSDKKTDWIIWLSEKKLPPIHANVIRFLNNDDATNLLTVESRHEEYASWILTKRITTKTALEENLTVQLGQILLRTKKYSKKILAFDRRTLPEKIAWNKNSKSVNEQKATILTDSGSKILSMLILILLIGERFVAYKRNQ